MKQGFKLLVDFRKDARRELQVALSAKQGLVSHVDDQQRQTCVQIIAITIPPLQAVNGNRCAESQTIASLECMYWNRAISHTSETVWSATNAFDAFEDVHENAWQSMHQRYRDLYRPTMHIELQESDQAS